MTIERETRNAIFSSEENIPDTSGIPTITKEESARQLGIEIAAEAFELPSRGLVYPLDSVLQKTKGLIEIKAMTANEENILMSRALIKKGTVLTELFKACVLTKGVDVESLLVGDRNALMVAIRVTGYGSDYHVSVQCPSCNTTNNVVVDLTSLETKYLDIDPIEPGQNAFAFQLPVTKKNVVFKFLTGKDEEQISAQLEAQRKRGLPDTNLITMRLFHSILSVEGITSRSDIHRFVQFMPARDSLALRQYIDAHEPGPDMSFHFQCSNSLCGFEDKIGLPITSEFFWPNSRR